MTEEKQKGVSADRENSGKADEKKDGKIERISRKSSGTSWRGKLGPSGAPFWSTRMLAKKLRCVFGERTENFGGTPFQASDQAGGKEVLSDLWDD